MPRRKKNGQSPARVPVGPSDGDSCRYRLPQGHRDAMANNFPSSNSLSSSDKDKIVSNMQEMFSHLDPEVLYIVLSECDFKVENAMDSLLELSVAAEVAAPVPPPVSGFEHTAAALLGPGHFSEPRPDSDFSKPSRQPPSPSSANVLTDELDLLVDWELEKLTAQQDVREEHPSSQYLSSGVSRSSYSPLFSQQDLPELLQSSLEPRSRGPSAEQPGQVASQTQHISGASPSLDQLSTWEDKTVEGQQSVVDLTHLMSEMPEDKEKPSLDLAASGRPSAFQVYKKQDASHTGISEQAGVMPSDVVVGGERSKVNILNQEPLGNKSSTWNLGAPVFSPRMHGNQGPAFITPVAQPPFKWLSKPRHLAPVGQAPLKPSATIPKSWAVHAALHRPDQHSKLRLEGKLLVLLRGAPGSGKSTLARALLAHNQGGVILSTDDYFTHNGEYQFDPTVLGEAHEWNHQRAKEAFVRGTNPIIIDNTNMQGWEMKPYVVQALRHGYKVLFREPDTWWKNKPRELERRTSHNVPVETIRHMLYGYERFVTVQNIMGSQMPEHKRRLLLENRRSKPVSFGTPCPDLVEQPELIEGFKKSHPQLFSSLPDVSSIGCSSEVGMLENSSHKSTESLVFPHGGKSTENCEIFDGDDDIDLGDLDSELDARLQMDHSVGGQRIPDCIVESVINEDHSGNEIPVAFSESIGQRVKRERPSRRSGFDQMEPADLVKDTNQSESKPEQKRKDAEAEQVELVRGETENRMPEMLDFVGDWPSQGSLEQRQLRRRERPIERNGEEGDGVSEETVQSEHPVTEFQKLVDLMQTGAAAIETSTSRLSSPSRSCGEELEERKEAGGMCDESNTNRSNSEERKQNLDSVKSSRGELPDCVLDWKAADSCDFRKSRINNQEGLKNEIETGNTTRGNDQVSDIGVTGAVDLSSTNRIDPLSTFIAEVDIEPGGGGHNDMSSNNYTDNGSTTMTDVDISQTSEVCQSPVCDGSAEADFNVGSQERKRQHSRRSGKQCKLALTFTQNCPASSSSTLQYSTTTAQNIDSCQITSKTDVEPNLNPTSNSSLNFKPDVDLFTESKSEANLQPLFLCLLVDTGCFTQTEPQDFALLWRLNHQDSPDNTFVTVCSHSSDFKVLSGDSSRFVPELSSAISAADAVHPSGRTEIPYHVVHEKGTQVEEKELGAAQDRFESLHILTRHFKLVNFDTLEDLYDKCHQDLEWTTNLLLDSGERFYKDEDGVGGEDDQNTFSVCGDLGKIVQGDVCANVLDEYQSKDLQKAGPAGLEEDSQPSTCETDSESNEGSSNTDLPCLEGVADPVRNEYHLDTTSQLIKASQSELSQPEATTKKTEHKVISQPNLDGDAWGGNFDDGVIIEESRVEVEDEMEREERQRVEERWSKLLDIQSLELRLPTELALQLTELFGPVGVDPGTCSMDNYAVKMDLNLAKLLHHKWKETIQERQRLEALSFHLLEESSTHWGESQGDKPWPRDQTQSAYFLISADGYASHDAQPEAHGQMPFMDHWNVSRPHVSLRDIMKEEQALQENVEKTRQSRVDLSRRDGATQLKENQLYALFPTIDRHFLQDIFRDHNYSLTQTELFLHSLLDEEPVKTVVAPETSRSDQHRAASKEREKRQKHLESVVLNYQDTEDPDYEDFRTEARLQKSRQLESLSKAAEAYKQGRKQVASFYAQQGHLHGQRMREANHRAAVQIFERVNSSLLPKNILDLHGLHVDEALEHLAQVLEDKTTDCEQGLCRPQLSIITGRGNHSQGGVARIRPAVIDYLTKKHYRFTEPKPGLILVSLK